MSFQEASTSGVQKIGLNCKQKLFFLNNRKLHKKNIKEKKQEDSDSEFDSSLIDDVILNDSSSEFEKMRIVSTAANNGPLTPVNTWIICIKCFR